MLSQAVTNVVGTPNDAVTHWGVGRKRKGHYTSGRDKWETLSYADERGVHQKLWPLDELSPEVVRERWGAGEYVIQWATLDPANPVPEHRHVAQGRGTPFVLDEVREEPEPAQPGLLPAAGTDPLLFAIQFAEMQDKKALRMLEAFRSMGGGASHGAPASAGPSEDVAALRAEIAAMRAETAAAEERRRLEDAHRVALAERDREIERLRREAEDAGRERSAGPLVDPETPLLEQLGPVVFNLAAANPEKAAAIVAAVGPIVADFLGLGKRPSAPAPAAAPALPARPMPAPAPVPTMRPVMRPVPPPAPVQPVPATSEAWGPIGGAPSSAAPPSPAAAAPVPEAAAE